MLELGQSRERILLGAGIGLIVAGLAALVGGWLAIRDEIYVAIQLPYVVSGGLGGLFLLGLGTMALRAVESGRQERRMAQLEADLQETRQDLAYVVQLLDEAVIETYDEADTAEVEIPEPAPTG